MTSGFYCKVTRKEEGEPCRHPRCAVARELYPNGIQNLSLHCIICTNDVLEKRARGHYKETCSAACNSVFKEWKKYVVESRFCPNCLHPHTPEHRADFHAWRKGRGLDWRLEPKDESKLIEAMKLILQMTDNSRIVEEMAKNGYRFDDDVVSRARKLVDTRKQNAVTLATSGISAPTGENNVTLG